MDNVKVMFVDGHFEVMVQGIFFESCDNQTEVNKVLQEIENKNCAECPFIHHSIFCNICNKKYPLKPFKRPLVQV